MTDLHAGLCEKLVMAPADELDVITSVDAQIHNVVAEAARMDWEFDLKDMWLTKSRWSMMVRQYLDEQELIAWLKKAGTLINWGGRGIAHMRTKQVQPRGGNQFGNKETRRWGSCMLGVSYKAVPQPQITLYSRTSYLGYLGAMDMSVAWMCGRYLAELIGRNVEDMKFVWFNEAMQYHHFKSLAFLLNHKDPERRHMYRHLIMARDDDLSRKDVEKIKGAPALMYSRRWMQKTIAEDDAGKTLGEMTYNTYRRIRRRYHTEVHGFDYALEFEGWQYWKKGPNAGEKRFYHKAYPPLPHVSIHDLDLSALGLPPLAELGHADYDAAEAEKALKEMEDA
jgi:hypothetical protein